MAPRIARYRETISAIPRYCALWFVLVSRHGQLGARPPPPFLSVSSWRACEVEVRYPPPPQKGYLSDTCAIPYENKANRVRYPPLRDMGGGGISHGRQGEELSLSGFWSKSSLEDHLEFQNLGGFFRVSLFPPCFVICRWGYRTRNCKMIKLTQK